MTHPQKQRTGLDRIVHAAGYSAAGLRAAWKHEAAFRQEAGLALVLLPAAFWLGRYWWEVALLAVSVLMVVVVELLNSAVEAAIDRIGAEHHELSGRAKDLGSAAVLVALLACALVWGLALWHRFVTV